MDCRDPTAPTYTEQVVARINEEVERVFRQRILSLQAEIRRLQAIVDKNAKTADLLDRTLAALEKQLEIPLEATDAAEKPSEPEDPRV